MSRPQWEKIVANAARERLVVYDQPIVKPIAAGGAKTVTFYSSPGTICKVIAMFSNGTGVTAATTGKHSIWISYSSPVIDITTGESSYNTLVSFNNNAWKADTIVPNDPAAALMAVQGIYFDEESPLNVSYVNGTDADKTEDVRVRIWAVERIVG